MTKPNLKYLISQGENDTIEFKTSFGKEAIVSLVAFASTKGGTVVIGVDDSGSISGVSCGQETIQNWINQCKINTSPSIIPDVELFEINGKIVVVVSVGEFPVKPISFKGRYYKRVSNSNHLLSATEIANIHLRSLQLSWDAYECSEKTLSDLDKTKIERFIDRVNESGRFQLHKDWKISLE